MIYFPSKITSLFLAIYQIVVVGLAIHHQLEWDESTID
jgi:hypothetical protein